MRIEHKLMNDDADPLVTLTFILVVTLFFSLFCFLFLERKKMGKNERKREGNRERKNEREEGEREKRVTEEEVVTSVSFSPSFSSHQLVVLPSYCN